MDIFEILEYAKDLDKKGIIKESFMRASLIELENGLKEAIPNLSIDPRVRTNVRVYLKTLEGIANDYREGNQRVKEEKREFLEKLYKSYGFKKVQDPWINHKKIILLERVLGETLQNVIALQTGDTKDYLNILECIYEDRVRSSSQ